MSLIKALGENHFPTHSLFPVLVQPLANKYLRPATWQCMKAETQRTCVPKAPGLRRQNVHFGTELSRGHFSEVRMMFR
jgi:hypothetical protein